MCRLKYNFPAINNGFIYVPSIGDDILKIKERKNIKKVIGNICRVTTLIENRLIASSEKMPKNLKKYKSLDIAESSTNMKDENEQSGIKSLKDSKLIENRNTSKKNISVDCIFLKAKCTYTMNTKETSENNNTTIATDNGL